MSKEYEKIMVAHPQYKHNIARWRYLFNSFQGGVAYANAGYLQKYSYETDIEYQQRILSTPLDNHVKGIVNIFNAFLFREKCDREFGALKMDPAVEQFLDDCDLDGRSLDAFMKDVSTFSSVFGHVWCLLVKPQTNARTRADELQQNVRPYITMITPMNVLDWRYRRAPNGVYYLEYLKYVEDNDIPNETVVREWSEVDIVTTVTIDDKKQIKSQTVEINELGQIPAVCVYNQRSTQKGIGISDVEDIARQQQLIYNLYSEIDSSTKLNGHPSLVKTSGTEAAAGPGAIVQIEDNLDPGLKPYMLSVSNDTQSMWASVQNVIDSIDRMANTAAVRAKSSRVLSGTAMEVEFSMLNARLSEKADNLELAEEQLWRLFALYQGSVWEGEINYPDSFAIHDKQNEFANLKLAKEAATDPRVLALVDHEIVECLGEDADLIMPEMVTLQSGQEVPADSAEPFDEPEELYNPETGESGWVIDFQSKREAMLAGWVEKE